MPKNNNDMFFDKKCVICGKTISMLSPGNWGYKKESKYCCSYPCFKTLNNRIESNKKRNRVRH